MNPRAFPEAATRDVVKAAPSTEIHPDEPPCPTANGRYKRQGNSISRSNATIHLALDTETQQLVAIKRLKNEFSQRPNASAQFQQSSEMLLKTGPMPCVAAHHAFDFDEHGPYLVMGWIEGNAFSELITSTERSFTPLTWARIFARLADAMHALHQKQILHCDLKLDNLLLDQQHTPWIVDFGSAIQSGAGDGPASAVSGWNVGGSDDYLPPERVADPPTVENRSDIYSLGMCLRFALTGKASDQLSTCDLPWPFRKIVKKATARGKDDRFRSMAEFADSLQSAVSCLQGRSPLCNVAAPLTLLLGGLGAWYQAGFPGLGHVLNAAASSPASAVAQHDAQPEPINRDTDASTPVALHTLNMQRIQQDEAQRTGVDVAFTNSQRQTFRLIPARISHGTRQRPDEAADETVQQRQQVLETYYLQTHEVSRRQFAEFVRQTGYRTEAETNGHGGWGLNSSTGQIEFSSQFNWQNPGFLQSDDHPVVLVGELDIQAYSQWLSREDNRNYRLPTENEWFHARRAGTDTRFWTGDDREQLTAAENIADNSARLQFPNWPGVFSSDGWIFTSPTGAMRANPFGLHDLVGNVAEYCCDHTTLQTINNGPRERKAVTTGRLAARVIGESFLGTPKSAASSGNDGRNPRIHCAAGFRLLCEIKRI